MTTSDILPPHIPGTLDPYEISQDDFEIREFYAYFGQAMSSAQAFELAIVTLTVAASRITGRIKSDRVHVEFDRLFKATLGQVLLQLKAKGQFDDPSILAKLDKCLDIRNRLCHRYWREVFNDGKPPSALTRDGRLRLIKELLEYMEIFSDMTRAVHLMFLEILKDGGVDREWIELEAQRLLADR